MLSYVMSRPKPLNPSTIVGEMLSQSTKKLRRDPSSLDSAFIEVCEARVRVMECTTLKNPMDSELEVPPGATFKPKDPEHAVGKVMAVLLHMAPSVGDVIRFTTGEISEYVPFVRDVQVVKKA